jgi:hypothetical protein
MGGRQRLAKINIKLKRFMFGVAEENKENQKQREIAAKKELFQLCGCSEESAQTLAEMSKDKTESIDNVMKVLAKKNNLQPQ